MESPHLTASRTLVTLRCLAHPGAVYLNGTFGKLHSAFHFRMFLLLIVQLSKAIPHFVTHISFLMPIDSSKFSYYLFHPRFRAQNLFCCSNSVRPRPQTLQPRYVGQFPPKSHPWIPPNHATFVYLFSHRIGVRPICISKLALASRPDARRVII